MEASSMEAMASKMPLTQAIMMIKVAVLRMILIRLISNKTMILVNKKTLIRLISLISQAN